MRERWGEREKGRNGEGNKAPDSPFEGGRGMLKLIMQNARCRVQGKDVERVEGVEKKAPPGGFGGVPWRDVG